MMKILTKEEFFDIEECECGKPVFKFHNTSKNIHVMKCMSTPQEYDIKTKKWVLSKKQPCKMYNIYKGDPAVICKSEQKKVLKENKPLDLKETLVSLFNFLPLSNYLSTLQEIDIIVKNNLKREPRKTFYFPSIGNLRVSHLESFEDYRNRIFSEEIVDRDIPPPSPPATPRPKVVVIKKQVKKQVVSKINDFVDVSDEESSSDTNSECSREYSDTDSDKQDSDYSEEHSEISEVYEEREDFDDDCSDGFGGGESDY